MRRTLLSALVVGVTCVASLVMTVAAQAVVVKAGATGQTGVALVPGTSLPTSVQRALPVPPAPPAKPELHARLS